LPLQRLNRGQALSRFRREASQRNVTFAGDMIRAARVQRDQSRRMNAEVAGIGRFTVA